MANWYVKGGSVFDNVNCKLYFYLDLSGYDEANYETRDDSHIQDEDPYIHLGGAGGAKTVVIGLYTDYRIEIDDANGIRGWNEGTSAWVNLLAPPGGSVEIDHIGASTYTTVQHWVNNTQSAGKISGGAITDVGDGTITVATGTGFIKSGNTDISPSLFFDWAASGVLTPTNNSKNYVYINYNVGAPIVGISNTNLSNGNTIFNIATLYREGTTLHILEKGQNVYNLSRRVHKRSVALRKFERASGLVTSETGTRNISITSGVLYRGLNEIGINAFDSSGADRFTYWYLLNGVWTKILTQSQIDKLQYNDVSVPGSEVLANITVNKYGVHWVFMDFDSHVHIIYGRGNYKLAEALNSIVPTQPTLIDEFAIVIGRIIIKQNQDTFKEVDTAFEIYFAVSEVIEHNDLGGLNDGTDYEHITQTQKDALHTIYSLEVHDNTHHNPNYKVDFSENTAFNKNFGSLGTEVCVGNDVRLSDARTPTAHVLATTGPHTGTLPWADLNKTGSSLAHLATRNHGSLSDSPADAHHTKYTNEEAQDAIGTILDDGTVGEIVFTYDDVTPKISGVVQDGEIDHNALNNYSANRHKLESEMSLANLGTRNHASLSDAPEDAHHNKQHAMDNATYHTSTDIATLNASTTKHGFLKKLDNLATHFMDGQGNWSVPTGTGLSNVVEDTTPQLGGNLELNKKNILFNPINLTNSQYEGDIRSATVDQNTHGFAGALHMDTDGNYIDADADIEANMPCTAMACQTGTGTKIIMKRGYIRLDSPWNWTPGELLWVSATGGSITATKPSTSGHFVQCIGHAVTADIIYFNPQYEYFKRI